MTDVSQPVDGPERMEAAGPPSSDGDLGRQVRRGLRWSFLTQLGVRAVSFGAGIALFRILRPADYGVYALALGVVNIVMSANDLGQVVAMMRWPGEHRRAAPTAATLAIATSALAYAAVFLAAPSIAAAADRPAAAGVVRLLALIVVIDGVTAVPRSLLFRSFRQDRLAAGELTGVPLNFVLSVSLALAGAGAWAPTIGSIAGAVANGGVVLRLAPEIVLPGWDREVARDLVGFGLPLAGTSLVEFSLLNVDYLLVGTLLGATALGFYALAFNVSSWPATVITQAVRRVSIASFAKLSGDGDRASLQRDFVRSAALLATLLLPICVGLSVLSPALIEVVYSAKGRPAATVLSWLAVLGGVRVLVGFVFDLLAGMGRSRTTLLVQALWLAAVVPALYVGARTDGIRGVAIGHVAVAVGVALPAFSVALWRTGVDLAAVGRALARPLAAALVAGAAALGARAEVHGPLAVLAIGGPTLLVVYVALAVPAAQLRRLSRAVKRGGPG